MRSNPQPRLFATSKPRERSAVREVKLTKMQTLLGIHIRELGYNPEYEKRVCDERLWRFDICIPDLRIACEISGGNWTGGHKRGKAQEDEYDKLNTAQLLGWRVLQFTNQQVADGRAKACLERFILERFVGFALSTNPHGAPVKCDTEGCDKPADFILRTGHAACGEHAYERMITKEPSHG